MKDIVCKHCGSINDTRKETGKGPHAFQLVCNGCDSHIKWLASNKPAFTDKDVMPWGKHKGTIMAYVPADYLIWVYENLTKVQPEVMGYIKENMETLRQQVENAR